MKVFIPNSSSSTPNLFKTSILSFKAINSLGLNSNVTGINILVVFTLLSFRAFKYFS